MLLWYNIVIFVFRRPMIMNHKVSTSTKIIYSIGAALTLIGAACLAYKTFFAPEYVDDLRVLHEEFYLIPVGLLFLVSGAIVLVHTAIRRRKH